MLKREDIRIRDPFIYTDADEGCYYMYGTTALKENSMSTYPSFSCYKSYDLENFEGPFTLFESDGINFWADRDFWAAELHKYKGKYYLFGSCFTPDHCRGSQIFVCDTPNGHFKPLSAEPITPSEWECIDGTLFVENDQPYMIFCHEWLQTVDGEMCVVELSADLKSAVSKPRILFKASESGWAIRNNGDGYVTDGPFLHRTNDGKLIMIWSGFSENGYAEAVAYSDNGSINGNWKHCEKMLSSQNGGHGMIFKDLNGEMRFTMHFPNSPFGAERAKIFFLEEIKEEPFLKMRD